MPTSVAAYSPAMTYLTSIPGRRQVGLEHLLDPCAVRRPGAIQQGPHRGLTLGVRDESPVRVAEHLVVTHECGDGAVDVPGLDRSPQICDVARVEFDGGLQQTVLRAEVVEQRLHTHAGGGRDIRERDVGVVTIAEAGAGRLAGDVRACDRSRLRVRSCRTPAGVWS